MAKALVERLIDIYNNSTYSPTEKETRMRNAFEELRKDNTLVQRVMSGRTTFSKEYEVAYGRYENSDFFHPLDSFPKATGENADELEACIGSPDSIDSIINYLFLSGSVVLPASLVATRVYITALYMETGRRELLSGGLKLALFAGLGGGATIGTFLTSMYKKQKLHLLKLATIVLDNTYSDLYEQQSPSQLDRQQANYSTPSI